MEEQIALKQIDPNPVCQVCGAELEWIDCWQIGCEDGQISLYDEDPLYYDRDDTEKCDICNGLGGWLGCPFEDMHADLGEEVGE